MTFVLLSFYRCDKTGVSRCIFEKVFLRVKGDLIQEFVFANYETRKCKKLHLINSNPSSCVMTLKPSLSNEKSLAC